MNISTIPTQLPVGRDTDTDQEGENTVIEGALTVSLPLLMYAQSRINREELTPLTLEAVLVGRGHENGFFYSCDPVVLWRSTSASSSSNDAALLASRRGRETVWSFCSDVSTGTTDHSNDDDFVENDRIFDTALRHGATFMQFPFRFSVPNYLPPTINPPPSDAFSESAHATCMACMALLNDPAKISQTSHNHLQLPGLIQYPQYEIMAMLSFESFAVSAYQVVASPFQLTRGLKLDLKPGGEMEVLEGEGVLAAGSFRYMIWDAPKYHVLESTRAYDFKLQISAGSLELTKIVSISIRPVHRYKHASAPEVLQPSHAHLCTPFQSSTQGNTCVKTLFLPPSPVPQTTATFSISMNLSEIPYPTTQNLGSWALENAIEVAVVFRPGATGVGMNNAAGSLGRLVKQQPQQPPHFPHLHHGDGNWVPHIEGTRVAFLSVPLIVVHPHVPNTPSATQSNSLNRDFSVDVDKEDEQRQELDRLMDRVEALGVPGEGTVSCLFSAKKLTRIGLKEWVDAGTDADADVSVTGRARKGVEEVKFEAANEGGTVAMYRSDAKDQAGTVKRPAAATVPATVTAPPSVLPIAPQLASPIATPASPYIPTRTISALAIPVELSSNGHSPASPSIPPRHESNDIRDILHSPTTPTRNTPFQKQNNQAHRQSIASSLNLVELSEQQRNQALQQTKASPQVIIPARSNSQSEKPRRIFVQLNSSQRMPARPLPPRPNAALPKKPLPTIPFPTTSIENAISPPPIQPIPRPMDSNDVGETWKQPNDASLDVNRQPTGKRGVAFADSVRMYGGNPEFTDGDGEDYENEEERWEEDDRPAISLMDPRNSEFDNELDSMSLGARMEDEILKGDADEVDGVGVQLESGEMNLSMVPRGRGVLDDDQVDIGGEEDTETRPKRMASLKAAQNGWRGGSGGIRGALGAGPGGSLPRGGVVPGGILPAGPGYGSMPRAAGHVGAEFGRSGSVGGGGQAFLSRMAGSAGGSLGRTPSAGRGVVYSRSEDQLRVQGSRSGGNGVIGGGNLGTGPRANFNGNSGKPAYPGVSSPPLPQGSNGAVKSSNPGGVVIAPRTSSARWNEEEED
ncbi:hypothetical protein CcCBS67573_g07661 [Chytriomyces confervae]|uniref:Uncharacterized protein n=1 Tax=Chytriomyces confervae TaxID=246404 RepID=A0A507EUA0_9FUNG|nr:hypothetical protein CcCBS67573_g07661 [Chytriomyces confervae]